MKDYTCERCGVDINHVHIIKTHIQGVKTKLEVCYSCYKEERGA